MASKKKESKSVLVTTQHRGVFWGALEATSPDGRTITLTGARNAIYWATSKGFIELAQVGPNSRSKVGAVATRVVLHDVTSLTECTAEANSAWERA